MRVAKICLSLTTILCSLCEISYGLYLSSEDTKYAFYLIKFGYLSRNSLRKGYVNDDVFRNALRTYQNYVRIGATGELDGATKNMMALDRCQAKDMYGSSRRRKRYTVGGNWPKKHITYKITKYSSTMSQSEVDSIIFLAFSVWSSSGGITVTKRNGGRSDIEVKFERIAPRADNHVFGNTNTQHKTSVITLNDEILWSQDFTTGLPNLFQTASHEVGHVLGLGHTDVVGAMMFPVYDLAIKIFSLHDDDMQGIREIYSHVNTISYPGKKKYQKFANNIESTFSNLADQFKNTFPGAAEIPAVNLPKNFFKNGF